MDNNTSIFYDLNEIAKILGTTKRTLMNYIKSGKIKCVKICGKWKMTKENLERYCRGEEQI